MAKIRFKDYLNKKKKQEDVLFESDEGIMRRIRDREDADRYIVSPDYRIENYTRAEQLARQIPGYPGIPQILDDFDKKKKEAKEQKKERALELAKRHFSDACTEDEFLKVQKECEGLDGKPEAESIAGKAAAKVRSYRRKTTRNRGIALAVLAAVAAAVIWMAVSGFVGYLAAKAEGMAGVYVSARNRFIRMGDYLDAKDQAEYYNQKYLEQREAQEKSSLSDADQGDSVDFGGFTWLVADRDGTSLTLVLKTIDDDDVFGPVPYNAASEDVTWESSSLREYLNTKALDAFAEGEQDAMTAMTHQPGDNSVYGTDGGSETEDLIRIPDTKEAENLISDGVFSAPGADVWLCTPGHDALTAAYMTRDGHIVEYGDDVTDRLSILAMVTVDYEKLS